MKIGVITIQKSEVNFGACLQSFALWKYITSLGYECEVIDLLRPCHAGYRISADMGERKPSLRFRMSRWFHQIIAHKDKHNDSERLCKYRAFNNQVKYSRCYSSVDELYRSKTDYDVLITGSDQVWNPNMPFLNDPYFLTFAKEGCKKISYASSFGIKEIPEKRRAEYALWLNRYNRIATREISGAKIVSELTGRDAEVVLDPVFLLDKDEWRSRMAPYNELAGKQFLLLYMLQYDEKVVSYAKDIAERERLPIYMVLSEEREVHASGIVQISDIGPAEWIWLIDNARRMVTTSFHGTAFCTIFGTPVSVYLKNGDEKNSRIEDLFKLLKVRSNEFDAKPDYIALMNENIEKSKGYLKSAIEE